MTGEPGEIGVDCEPGDSRSGIQGVRLVTGTGAGITEAARRAVRSDLEVGTPACLLTVGGSTGARRSLVSTAAAHDLVDRIDSMGLPGVVAVAAAGFGHLHIEDGSDSAHSVEAIFRALEGRCRITIGVPDRAYRGLFDLLGGGLDEIVLVASDPGDPVVELAVEEARRAGCIALVQPPPPPPVRAVLDLAVARIRDPFGTRFRRRNRMASERGDAEAGQVLPLVGGVAFVLVAVTVGLVAIAGAVSGKARAQGVADLAALSAARSMRDDLPRLLAPATLPNGLPNPAHISKPVYLGRATRAATITAVANGGSPGGTSVSFPDGLMPVPLRSQVRIRFVVEGAKRPSGSVWAESRIGLGDFGSLGLALATGGGYSGLLAVRQGHGMRPDVAFAFDRMASAAARSGVSLSITSAFRSDAEQARLFAANPDPRWVAPPGRSLHRCGTELDLGPPGAYAWLAANASRFGFTKRYSWEPWHFGFTAGPAPCSASPDSGTSAPAGGARSPSLGVPAFVPPRFRRAIVRAGLRHGISPALLAAQLRAESGFDPGAVSPAGALGIAQFMPTTAIAWGLRDPFDPLQSIEAQARLMSNLLGRFRSVALALAAYNAGPGAVAACNCIPDYPETRAYVSRILSTVPGDGGLVSPELEVELVR